MEGGNVSEQFMTLSEKTLFSADDYQKSMKYKTKQYLRLPCVETFGQRSPYWKEKEININLFCKCCVKMLDYKDNLLQFTFS